MSFRIALSSLHTTACLYLDQHTSLHRHHEHCTISPIRNPSILLYTVITICRSNLVLLDTIYICGGMNVAPFMIQYLHSLAKASLVRFTECRCVAGVSLASAGFERGDGEPRSHHSPCGQSEHALSKQLPPSSPTVSSSPEPLRPSTTMSLSIVHAARESFCSFNI